jgi:hypothetical protein
MKSFDVEKTRRGPYFFLEVKGDSLYEMSGENQFLRMALGAILSVRPEAAREMLQAQRDRDSTSALPGYWLAWVEWDLGDRDRALERLRAIERSGSAPLTATGRAALARGDTLGALRIMQQAVMGRMLDAEAHGLLADLTQLVAHDASEAVIEAYAARLLAPDSPAAWRRWAIFQIRQDRPLEAAGSLRRYFDLAGAEAALDGEAQSVAAYLRARYPVTVRALEPKRPAP